MLGDCARRSGCADVSEQSFPDLSDENHFAGKGLPRLPVTVRDHRDLRLLKLRRENLGNGRQGTIWEFERKRVLRAKLDGGTDRIELIWWQITQGVAQLRSHF